MIIVNKSGRSTSLYYPCEMFLFFFNRNKLPWLNHHFILMKGPISKLNKEWHRAHPMPKHATTDQRIEWHFQHAKHCSCRPVPEKLRTEIKKRLKN